MAKRIVAQFASFSFCFPDEKRTSTYIAVRIKIGKNSVPIIGSGLLKRAI